LYTRARVLGYQRSQRKQHPNATLLGLENVKCKEDTEFYMGKRVAYIYRAERPKNGSKIRVIWGRVTRPHGTSGVVRAKFRKNLPGSSFGSVVRVMMYPSRI
ncbi:60S ribosomal protein L33B, partial [Dimargaris xerosporica]